MLCIASPLSTHPFNFDTQSGSYYEGDMFKGVLLSILLTIGANTAFAETVEGQVAIIGRQKYLVLPSAPNEVWKLEGTSDQVKAQLSGLSHGDFLSATGEMNLLRKIAFVETVDFVGLKRILGRWVSKDGYIIDFIDFRSAVVEQKQHLPWNPSEDRKVNVVYTILPKKNPNWSLLMSNRKTVRVGTLSIQDDTISIQLVDQKTGQITEDISLSPSTDLP